MFLSLCVYVHACSGVLDFVFLYVSMCIYVLVC